MILKTLSIRNFKGITKLDIDFKNGGASIFGDNGTGKTSVADAIFWLLFDKDSKFNSKFSIKPLDKDGTEKHNLESMVTAEFVGGSLSKVYKEQWTKKRGAARPEFTGHTTDYYIDGVPAKMKEYKEAVGNLASEEQMKLMTNPFYFCEELNWKDRRKIVMEVSGTEFSTLPAITGDRTIDDYKKILAAKKTEINRRLTEIPARIDELAAALSGEDPEQIRIDIGVLEEEKGKLELVKAEAIKRQNTADLSEYHEELKAWQERAQRERNKLADAEHLSGMARRAFNSAKQQEDSLLEEKALAVREVNALRERVLGMMQSGDSCHACGTSLPEDHPLVKHREAEIQKYREEGIKKAAYVKTLEQKETEQSKIVARLREELAMAEKTSLELAELNSKRLLTDPAPEEPNDDIRDECANIILETEANLNSVYEQISWKKQRLAVVEQNEKLKIRISELEAEETRLAAEYSEAEREIFELENAMKAAVEAAEEKIFKAFGVKFKMFAEQVNGGLTETCEVLVDGVPFGSGLNRGAQINAGLKVVSVLQKHFKVDLPVIVDNAEAVTRMKFDGPQLIRLVVSEEHKKLEVVCDGK